MALTTTTQFDAPINRIFQTQLLATAEPLLPYFVGSVPGEIQEHAGSFNIRWRRHDKMTPTTTALSELTGTLSLPTRTATQLSLTHVDATVQKYGDFVFITEELDLLNPSNTMNGIINTLGMQAGESLNRLQRNQLEDNATLIRPGGLSQDSDITDSIGNAIITLGNNTLARNSTRKFTARTLGSTNIQSTPVRPAFWGICHVDVEEDIRNLTGFLAAERYGSQTALELGEFGMAKGVRWIATEEASIDTDTGGNPGGTLRATSGTQADLYTSLIFGIGAHGSVGLGKQHVKEVYMSGDKLPAIMMILKARGTSGVADPLNEAGSAGWKSWHAPAILNTTWIRGLRHGATNLQ